LHAAAESVIVERAMRVLADVRATLRSLKETFSSPDGALVDLVLARLSDWQSDDSSAETLIHDLEGLVAEVHFSTHEAKAKVALAIAGLHDTVEALGGMTMNERLVSFDLFHRWDRSSENERAALYDKVLASVVRQTGAR
jgi:hypothetical protein